MENYKRINLEFLENFTKGDKGKMTRYINMFLQLAPLSIQTMKAQWGTQDWINLRTTAHSLKPQLAYMGIDSIKEHILRIEEYAGEGKNPQQIEMLIAVVEEGCNEAFSELNDVIQKIA